MPSTRWTRRRSTTPRSGPEIKTETGNFLKRTGFNPDKIPLIPISGFNGDNTTELSENMPWYKVPTLHEAHDNVQEPVRPVEKHLRLPLQDVDKISCLGLSPSGVLRRVS